MSTTIDPRIAILSDLSDPPYNEVTETRCVPWDDAVKLLNSYRASVLREVAVEIEGIDAHPNATGRHSDIYMALAHRFRRQADEAEQDEE